MKNIILITTLLFTMLSCKAQVIGTLEQFEECSMRPNHNAEGCPDLENITYVKDTNNRLDQFVGIWKGNYGGKQYEIRLEKKVNYKDKPSDELAWDMIRGRILIKNSSGNIIYNSMNKSDNDTHFWGYNFRGRVYQMHFVGNYDCLESGNVSVEIKPNNPNEMLLSYYQDRDGLLNPAKCPNYSTFVPLLPIQKMTLVKQ
ncbi:hypothetical protein N0B16_12210 [Chryseobacterium sp. GMJ5]|uniref:DUF6705 domain-containing protein n=1 Tax=Chryseobacterium gilvum TaxID=2976534 RepID=A0ABT2VZX2_9FLAO|nr:DUF6705 family protein [Chryseobacterium gilvum]MCU7615203.1 hypothetical protein [Chryseobacterium gilvum]